MNGKGPSELSTVRIPEERNWHRRFIHLVYLQHQNVHLQKQKYITCYAIHTFVIHFMFIY